MSLAGELLVVAEELCPSEVVTPSEARLRRSISTSYYAAFHALSDEVARPYSEAVRLTARRMLEHISARDVADTLMRGTMPWLDGRPPCHELIIVFASDFDHLQLARHRADYDLGYAPTRADAVTAVARARRAIDSLAEAHRTCPDQIQAMCVAMVAAHGLRRRMSR